MGRFIDLAKQRFGRYVVLYQNGVDKQGNAIFWCKCDCGTERNVSGNHLRAGHTKSCGCLRRETSKINGTNYHGTHGMSSTRERNAWHNMIDRCTNKNHSQYKNYGGRGIKVSDEFRYSLEKFCAYIGNIPKGMSLDRINNNGNYERGNLRFATPKEQANNRRKRKVNNGG